MSRTWKAPRTRETGTGTELTYTDEAQAYKEARIMTARGEHLRWVEYDTANSRYVIEVSK